MPHETPAEVIEKPPLVTDLDKEPATREAEKAPAQTGSVTLSKEEHDRIQAEARVAQRKLAKLEKEQADRVEREKAEAARAAGDFDEALRLEREKREKLEAAVLKRDVRDAVRDVIAAKGVVGSKAAALMRLVDVDSLAAGGDIPVPELIEEQVDATVALFPDLFVAIPEDPEPRVKRTPGPASPPAAKRDDRTPDYVSPEEYQNTPHEIRLSPEFRDRVRQSRPHWPKIVPANTFSVDS